MIADQAFEQPPKLIDHYRSHEGLIGLCDELCGYELTVHTESKANHSASLLSAPLVYTNVEGQQLRSRGSWYNERELDVVLSWVFYLLNCGVTADQVAILTPYLGQLDAIRAALHVRGIELWTAVIKVVVFDFHRYRSSFSRWWREHHHLFAGGHPNTVASLSEPTRQFTQCSGVMTRQHFITVGHAENLAKGRLRAISLSVPKRFGGAYRTCLILCWHAQKCGAADACFWG